MAQIDTKELEQVGQRVVDARAYLHIDEARKTLADLDMQVSQPGFWDDQAHAQAVSKQASNLRDTLQEYDEAVSLLADAQTAAELAEDDESFADEAQKAIEKLAKLLVMRNLVVGKSPFWMLCQVKVLDLIGLLSKWKGVMPMACSEAKTVSIDWCAFRRLMRKHDVKPLLQA